MKKFFIFLLILAGSILPCQVVAYDFRVDGIYYNITSAERHTVAVTSGTDKYVGSVVIPESVTYDDVIYSVTTIFPEAFSNCGSLTSVTIPNSVTTIGYTAFFSCTSLTSVTIPNSVTTIGNGAFLYCTSLTSVTIPNSVTTIAYSTFSNCSNLTSITIGNSVTAIDDYAFQWCRALRDFYCHAESVPTTGNNIFSSVNQSSVTLHVPETYLQEYSSTAPWCWFGQIVALTESDGIERLTSEANNPATAYSLDGRRVAKPRKGIYVIGGRKTVVR